MPTEVSIFQYRLIALCDVPSADQHAHYLPQGGVKITRVFSPTTTRDEALAWADATWAAAEAQGTPFYSVDPLISIARRRGRACLELGMALYAYGTGPFADEVPPGHADAEASA